MTPVVLYVSVCTPTGKLIQLDAVKTTRSGRAVKPVLAWYAGQSVTVDPKTNSYIVNHRTKYAESVLKDMTEFYKVGCLDVLKNYFGGGTALFTLVKYILCDFYLLNCFIKKFMNKKLLLFMLLWTPLLHQTRSHVSRKSAILNSSRISNTARPIVKKKEPVQEETKSSNKKTASKPKRSKGTARHTYRPVNS